MGGFLSTVRFTETRAYVAVIEKLEQRGHVLILGRPGDGKTTLGFRTLHTVQEKHNCIPILPIQHNLDFLAHLRDTEKMSIFLDDLFGIYSLTGEVMSKTLVYQILNLLKKGSSLVMSMRNDIFRQCKMQLPKELFSQDVIIDLTKPEFELLENEKRSMLQSIPNVNEDTIKSILRHPRFSNQQIGFPQCVVLMKESDVLDFKKILETPFNFIMEQLCFLFERCREKFIALVLAFASQGHICEEDIGRLRCDLPKEIDDSSYSVLCITQAMKNLVATYFIIFTMVTYFLR